VYITLNVARSQDEADLQAQGQDVTAIREETEYEHVSREELEEELLEPGVELDAEESAEETEKSAS